MLIYSIVEVLLLLIASSVVSEKARRLRRGAIKTSDMKYIDICDLHDERGVACSNVEAAAVFGFLALVLFLADAVFYLIKYRSIAENESANITVQEGGPASNDTNPNSVDQIP